MPTIRIHIAYDGTDFHGWQKQPNTRTVEGEILRALSRLHNCEPAEVEFQGASRTDAGVHALGQVASFASHPDRDVWDYVRGLNAMTPDDITINHGEIAPETFNARHHSAGKLYRYLIWNHRFDHPLLRRTHWGVREPLDIEPMRAAAEYMLGTHDFSAFRASDCQAASTVREVTSVELTEFDGCGICIEVRGTAFLKNMVRIMAGTLVDVGRRVIVADSVADIISGADRAAAGITAPARGLTLVEVFYPEHPWTTPPTVGLKARY